MAVTAFGSYYHMEHFVCVKCRKKLPEGECFKKGEELWCAACIEETKAKCAGCNLPLGRKAIAALGKHWHEQCLRCERCKKPFKDSTILPINGKQYCPQCAPLCNN
uniref:LIM zinc-binding domain-containing protein n=1 Tax=Trichuris muris TaxID=70415 RepID=A0A5S6Q6Q4_TRIMR